MKYWSFVSGYRLYHGVLFTHWIGHNPGHGNFKEGFCGLFCWIVVIVIQVIAYDIVLPHILSGVTVTVTEISKRGFVACFVG